MANLIEKRSISFHQRSDGPVEITRGDDRGRHYISKEWCAGQYPSKEVSHRTDGPADLVKFYNPSGDFTFDCNWYLKGKFINQLVFGYLEYDVYDMTDEELLMFGMQFG